MKSSMSSIFTSTTSQAPSPIFTLLNLEGALVQTCSTIDFDPKEERPVPLVPGALVLDKRTCSAQEKDSAMFAPLLERALQTPGVTVYSHYGVLGVLTVGSERFLLVVADMQQEGFLPTGSPVFKLTKIESVAFGAETAAWGSEAERWKPVPQPLISEQAKAYLEGIKAIYETQNFYFSYFADLTNNCQHQHLNSLSVSNGESVQDRLWFRRPSSKMKDTFVWNLEMMKPFTGISPLWTVPVIQGFFSFSEISTGLSLVLLSRRSHQRGGARFYNRGIDDEGQCGNFVETEVMLWDASTLCSYSQVRGSIPLFWEQQQNGLIARMKLLRNEHMTAHPLAAHLSALKKTYFGQVTLLNLVSKAKPEEHLLTVALEKTLSLSDPETASIRHVKFDFHTETSGGNFKKVSKLLDEIEDDLSSFGFFSIEMKSGTVLSTQQGIFRTHCIDCLDRTNVTQSKICKEVVMGMLKEKFKMAKPPASIEDKLKSAWITNGDVISLQYTGTASNISGVQKKNKKGLLDKLNQWSVGVSRYLQHVMKDDFKQECISLITSKHSWLSPPLPPLDASKGSTSIKEKICFVSWNLAGLFSEKDTIENLEMGPLLKRESEGQAELPSIVVFALQNYFRHPNPANLENYEARWSVVLTRALRAVSILKSVEYVVGHVKAGQQALLMIAVRRDQTSEFSHLKSSRSKVFYSALSSSGCSSASMEMNFGRHLQLSLFSIYQNKKGSASTKHKYAQKAIAKDQKQSFNLKPTDLAENLPTFHCKVVLGHLGFKISLKAAEMKEAFQESKLSRLKTFDEFNTHSLLLKEREQWPAMKAASANEQTSPSSIAGQPSSTGPEDYEETKDSAHPSNMHDNPLHDASALSDDEGGDFDEADDDPEDQVELPPLGNDLSGLNYWPSSSLNSSTNLQLSSPGWLQRILIESSDDVAVDCLKQEEMMPEDLLKSVQQTLDARKKQGIINPVLVGEYQITIE